MSIFNNLMIPYNNPTILPLKLEEIRFISFRTYEHKWNIINDLNNLIEESKLKSGNYSDKVISSEFIDRNLVLKILGKHGYRKGIEDEDI